MKQFVLVLHTCFSHRLGVRRAVRPAEASQKPLHYIIITDVDKIRVSNPEGSK